VVAAGARDQAALGTGAAPARTLASVDDATADALVRVSRLDWSDLRACHTLRIAAKKMRYTHDIMAFPARDPLAAAGFAKAPEAVQDALGALNDLAMTPPAAALAQSRPRGRCRRAQPAPQV
jgi:CHAD domain-containing protein